MEIKLTAVFRKFPEGYAAFVEELPGANTQGATLEEARENLKRSRGDGASGKSRINGKSLVMTAAEIIDGIKRLPPEEQAGVVRFVYQLDAERKLNGPELSALAQRFVTATDPAEASRASAKKSSAVFTAARPMPKNPAAQSSASVA